MSRLLKLKLCPATAPALPCLPVTLAHPSADDLGSTGNVVVNLYSRRLSTTPLLTSSTECRKIKLAALHGVFTVEGARISGVMSHYRRILEQCGRVNAGSHSSEQDAQKIARSMSEALEVWMSVCITG